jgi:hypothetical protein
MNERERWVVYPLLFLALGAALRDKLIDRTTTKRIICEELMVCEQLSVVDGAPTGAQMPRPLVQIGRTGTSPGRIAQGIVIVNGHVQVAGQVDANQYAYGGRPLTIPAFVPMDLYRALQSLGSPQRNNQN